MFDAVIIRSTWDYHLHPIEFKRWLARLRAAEVPVWNSTAIIGWNMDKGYLEHLSLAGIAVVPTVRLTGADTVTLRSVLKRHGWTRAVVKPSVSASAYDTWQTTAELAAFGDARVAMMLERSDVLVQPFIEEIDQGEWSLVFLGGEFSHAVIKRTAKDDFRVQRECGGSAERAVPRRELIEFGQRVLACAPDATLYARVDVCLVNGAPMVMELELIEPSLFLDLDAGAPKRFADAILARIADVRCQKSDASDCEPLRDSG
ncbi:MAG: hypothetical protein M3081_03165 [Gemmatimonadota bacterium]|nr:hypothetical protein [Gemmatimonadota bacterium]